MQGFGVVRGDQPRPEEPDPHSHRSVTVVAAAVGNGRDDRKVRYLQSDSH
jgi:hypothetical protein